MKLHDLHLLTVYQSPFKKYRLGTKHDGGYVIAEIAHTRYPYDCYVTAGINDNESFSAQFIKRYQLSEYNSFAIDGTMDYPFEHTRNISVIHKNISCINDHEHCNLDYIMNRYRNIFLKMDIEGQEYPWLINMPLHFLYTCAQIVIEFHGINNDSWGTCYEDKIKCLEILNTTHYIIHIHGNNNSGCTNNIPDVLEITYLHKKYFETHPPDQNTVALPKPNLDYVCNPSFKDYDLNFPPFVYPHH